MPKLFSWHGYHFFFFSDEGDPLEPCHIHVRKAEQYAKIWIEPYVRLDRAYGISSPQLSRLLKLADERRDLIREKWNEDFSL
jgi:hypothetical protein